MGEMSYAYTWINVIDMKKHIYSTLLRALDNSTVRVMEVAAVIRIVSC